MMINQIERTRRSAAQKLAPCNVRITTVVRSLLGYLLNEQRWASPYIIDLRCGEDGMLLAYESDSGDYLRMLVKREELVQGVLMLAQIVDLTPGERSYLLSRVPSAPKLHHRTRN